MEYLERVKKVHSEGGYGSQVRLLYIIVNTFSFCHKIVGILDLYAFFMNAIREQPHRHGLSQ